MRLSHREIILFILADLSPIACYAQSAPLPQTLMWQNRPVDPSCISQLAENDQETPNGVVDLSICTKHEDITINPDDLPFKDTENGYGYSYRSNEYDQGDGFPEYIGYKYIGEANGLIIISVNWSGGGTGHFSQGLGLQRQGDTLQIIKQYQGGDRCNGGINDMKVENNKVLTENSITAADMLTLLPNLNPHNLKHFENLEDCAICCIGSARYVDGQLTAFINDEGSSTDENARPRKKNKSPYTNQDCFDDLLSKMPVRTQLSVEQIKDFMNNFNRVCVEKSAP